METFNLKIVTLDGIEYDGFVSSVVARTTSGDVCILKNHELMLTFPIHVK